MNYPKNVFTRRSLTVVLTMFVGIGLATALLVFGQVNQALAQGITVDGDGSDWDPAWVVRVDPYDVIYDTLPTRFDPLAYARWGYEVLSLSAHYSGDAWYFKIDVDGRPGDADSRRGTASDPGVGTTWWENGPLAGVDVEGIGDGEAYRIVFDYHTDNTPEEGPQIAGTSSVTYAPGIIYSTTNALGPLVGNVAFGDAYTPTGVVEFMFSKANLFPAGSCRYAYRVRAQAGSNWANVASDYVPSAATFLPLLVFDVSTRVITTTGSNVVTYTIPYTITGNAATPAHNAYITQTLGANSYFVSCSGGASCFHGGATPGGMITWMLTNPITPGTASATGIVTSVISTASLADQTTVAHLGADEGLCAESSTTFTPTLVSLSELHAESVGLLNRFWWTALSLAGAAAALFVARRKARAV